ncbi:MAG: phenylalanine--tRNA ligase subunit alpha [Gammaproteobacteria bacterium]|nr:phenylalanine--tRNA ligase subunit alpha [Gammaproteobacteria bacterium]MBU1629250.1 phenylalanine--tRNA ligase subunit alpha [Gammaproteobacteria bacterium]MBU1927052.1 phenylalanine--tRNA ligase subunit alpha [Gammaproteobacteria bacterium]MBU2545865.1 phenylalanine--tRNA ligase subunit alpha [Gammaproteobacteria bacterium]
MQELSQILSSAKDAIQRSDSLQALEELRVRFFGKKGELTDILKTLGTLPPEERQKRGAAVNEVKEEILKLYHDKERVLSHAKLEEQLASEQIDVTLPGRGQHHGSLHPVMTAMNRMVKIFSSLGFVVASGPEIEDEYHNFDALNIPANHPARAMHDTFYFPDGKILRTQMSPVQIRYMAANKPPIRMVAPGKVYRCDFDATHTPMFHQLEGLLVDEGVSLSHLKGVLSEFFQAFFETKLKVRLRPSYFPFTEPSAEADIECLICRGKEAHCKVCHGTGWLEVVGCGMVHPKVLQRGGIDSEKYTGYAFGFGIDRMAMLFHGIDDLRLLFEDDVRFLGEFR